MSARASSGLRALAWIACAFAFCVIVFGAFVRLSNAGLSCPDWPTCYGHVTWPQRPHAIAQADAAFPDRPYETAKAWREQTHRFLAGTLGVLVLALALSTSWRNRARMAVMIAGIALVAIGIPFYIAKSYVASAVCASVGEALLLACAIFWRHGGWRRIAVLALAVVAFQALLGMWTVTWLLKPIVVSGHLLGGMTTFALLAWIAWWLTLQAENPLPPGEGGLTAYAASAGEGTHSKRREAFIEPSPQPLSRPDILSRQETPPWSSMTKAFAAAADASVASAKRGGSPRRERGLFAPVLIGLILLTCQIALGGWTSSNYAALACGTDFPKCLGHWWPPVDFHQGFILWRGIGVNFEGGILDAAARSAIQIAHRFGALIVFAYLAWLAHRVSRAGLRGFGIALGLLLIAQVALGIGNVKLGLPLVVAVAHNAGAALLLFVMVALIARTQRPRVGNGDLAIGKPVIPAKAGIQ